jgi:uncharacterized protein YbaP (TraB family)
MMMNSELMRRLKRSFSNKIARQSVVHGCCCLLLAFSTTALGEQSDTALLWSIMEGERQAGYLLGTIHSEDPRVLDFPEDFLEKLSSNEVFAMEMVPDLPTLSRLTEYMQYQDGTSLQGQVGPERFEQITRVLAHYQMPSEWVAKMKVWATVMTLSVPPPETGFFMDFSLSLRAAGSGLRVVGLETLEEQLSFLENMPMEQQLALLDQALLEYDRVQEVHDLMVDNYLSGDLQALAKEADAQLDQLDSHARDYFMSEGIDARNLRMLRAMLPLLDQNRVFIAVGALHLPGESGLLTLLRKQGYRLEPLALPFKVEKL